jgi:hypothetical protein
MVLASETNGRRYWKVSNDSMHLNDIQDVNAQNSKKSYVLTYDGNVWEPQPATQSGLTTERPLTPYAGMMYFDLNIGKPIWYHPSLNGQGGWVDATGTQV